MITRYSDRNNMHRGRLLATDLPFFWIDDCTFCSRHDRYPDWAWKDVYLEGSIARL